MASTAHPAHPDNVAEPSDGTPEAADADTAAAGRLAVIRRRLDAYDHRLDPWSWAATAVVVGIAAILRLVGLAHPPGKIFDEIYYAKDAWGLLDKGVEWNYKDGTPSYVVHPPLGKWLIALGQWAFGYQEADGERVMKQPEITVRVVLNRGSAATTIWTCDLSHDYVTINAEYRT